MAESVTNLSEIDLNSLTPRLHNNCWVVSDSRKWHGRLRKNSLVQNGAIFTETDSLKLADELNKLVYHNIFGESLDGLKVEIKGPFYAYRLATAKSLGLLE